jgi:hypothetical protein
MLKRLVGEGAEMGGESEKMVVIFKPGPRYAEEGLSSDKLKDKTAKTPDVKGFVDGSSKNQFGRSKAVWSNGFYRRVRKEICCAGLVIINTNMFCKKKQILAIGYTNLHPYQII